MLQFWVRRIRRWLRPRWPASRPVVPPSYTPQERRDMLRGLSTHPGFVWLMAEIESKRYLIESGGKHLAQRFPVNTPSEIIVRELARDEEALHWLGFIQDLVRRSHAMPDLTEFETLETRTAASTERPSVQ